MKQLLTVFLALSTYAVSAQTLFHYGQDSVSAEEFLKAYNKNNTGDRSEKAMREYFDLYLASRLKIKEAKDEGYDTLPQIASDIQGLRRQILPAYINDKKSMDKLVDEAFARSQKNIHIAHIFIKNTEDPAVADRKKDQVMEALKTKKFSDVAREFSDDPSAKTNGGDLGWITAFTLPYALENLAYATPVGKYNLYRSKAGYHIFKNLEERKDLGRMKAAQILLAFPPGATDEDKANIKKLADSLYQRITKGDDFGKLASQFSNDIVSAASKGQMQEFGVGQYEKTFEEAAFGLTKDGAVTKPFLTSYGYHIVKRISKNPATTTKDEKTMELLKNKIQQSDRMATVKAALAQKVRTEAGFKELPVSKDDELFPYTDSLLNGKRDGRTFSINDKTPLISFAKSQSTVADWIRFATANRFKQDGTGLKPYQDMWTEFVDDQSVHYYEDHLEDFNEEFRNQLEEFSEGNLFFEIMQRKVWGPAQSDSAALERYYNEHRERYVWEQSADAVVFYATDKEAAETFLRELKKTPEKWLDLTTRFGEKIAADSGRIEISNIPNPTKMALRAGTITQPLVNKGDQTASFAYVIKLHPANQPRSFAEARGLVINDYQQEIERQWMETLKKKYPVRVNEDVLKKLLSAKK